MNLNIEHKGPSSKWRQLLSKLFEDGDNYSPVEPTSGWVAEGAHWNDLVSCQGHEFAINYKSKSDTASVSAAVTQINKSKSSLPAGFVPLLVVDYMGETGKRICSDARLDWIDLAGNARIVRPPYLRIIVQGQKRLSMPRGRKSNVFAPKSSRVAHWFLMHAQGVFNHQEIAEATGVDKGHLSRILKRLEELKLIERLENGFQLKKPRVLLEAWKEAFEFPYKNLLKGVIPSRSGEETVRTISEKLNAEKTNYVFGGLSAAWFLDGFADFRLATCYVKGGVPPAVLDDLGFVETDRGANVWFIQEPDEVALMGSKKIDGVVVASPFYTYIDLSVHPERSSEAAEHLSEHVLALEVPDEW